MATQNSEPQQLQDRIARLEARLRLVMVIVALGGVALFGYFVLHGTLLYSRTRVSKANAYLILAEDGTTRGWLGVGKDGVPALRLLGPDGKTRAIVRVESDGKGAVRLYDGASETPIWSAP